MDWRVPTWPGRGNPMDDDHPLFDTFNPISEDKKAKTEPNVIPTQCQGAEQPLGHGDTHDRVPRGSWPSPPGCSSPEGDPQPELVVLRAQTRLWFEQSQARRLRAEGELPPWFHGFISRRETEQLLQDQPQGCFLVRFSESTVGFVLSYRGGDRCRHFVLDQLPDGRYVILGEKSAHTELNDLLRHYTTAPITPYHEFLTVPRKREGESQRGTWTPVMCSPSSKANFPEYSIVVKGTPGARQGARNPSVPPELSAQGGSSKEVEAPSVPPPLPAKSSSLAAAQGPHSPTSHGAAPKGASAQVHKEVVLSELPASLQLADAKYQELLRFHTYAEPHEGITSGSFTYAEPHEGITSGSFTYAEPHEGITSRSSTYYELQEPIPFYAMGRGSSPRADPEENIYSEVALAQQDMPTPLPRGSQSTFSMLPPKPHAHRRLFRSVSSQVFKKRQLPAAPTADGKERGASSAGMEGMTNPRLEFDDPVYGLRTSVARRATAAAGQEGPENIYEQLSGDHP